MPSKDDRVRPGSFRGGFNIIVKDLDTAFALGLTPNQAIIMREIREQSWAKRISVRKPGEERPRAARAHLNISALAKATDLSRTRISAALKALLLARILVRAGDGFLIRKDYHRWRDDTGTKRRFTKKQIAYILASQCPKKESTEQQESKASLSQNATPPVAKCDTPLSPIATPPVANCDTDRRKMRQSEPLHIEERARNLDLEIKERPNAVVCDARGEPINLDCGEKNDPAEIHRLGELADHYFPGLWFNTQVSAYGKTFPAAWIERALEDARSWRNAPRSFTPILNKLREWARSGGPPEDFLPSPPPNGVAPSRAPANPTEARNQKRRADAEALRRKLQETADGQG